MSTNANISKRGKKDRSQKIHRRKSNMSEAMQDRVVKIKVIGVGGAGIMLSTA